MSAGPFYGAIGFFRRTSREVAFLKLLSNYVNTISTRAFYIRFDQYSKKSSKKQLENDLEIFSYKLHAVFIVTLIYCHKIIKIASWFLQTVIDFSVQYSFA